MEIDWAAVLGLGVPIATTAGALWLSRYSTPRKPLRRQGVDSNPVPRGLRTTARLIERFYRKRDLYVGVVDGVISYRSSQLTFNVGIDLEVKKIERTAQDLEHYLKASGIQIVPGSLTVTVSGQLTVSYNHDATKPVLLSTLFRKGELPLPGSFVLGLDLHGNVFRLPMDTEAYPHTLIVGSTGSGKTVAGLVLAANALALGWDVDVYNPKARPINRTTWGLWQLRDGGNVAYAQDYDDMVTAAGELSVSMDKLKRPRLVLVDEAADILERKRDEIATPLGTIAQKGREYNCHVALMVPKATKAVLINDMLHANAGTSVIGMRMNSAQLSQWGTGIGGLNLHLLAGHGHAKVMLGSEKTEIQFALPDNLDSVKVPGVARVVEKNNLLPVTMEWFSSLGVGDPVSKASLREYASKTNQGIGYSTVREQWEILERQGRVSRNGDNVPGVKVK